MRPRRLKLGTHVDSGQIYRAYRNQAAAAPICPLFLHFSFSNFQTLEFFVTLFSETVRPRRLELGTHVDSGEMYCVYGNQVAALIHSFISSFFFLSNFQTLKFFVTLFSQKLWGLEGLYLLHMWTVGRCIMCTGIRLLLLICPFISFSSNFQTLKFFVILFSGTVRSRRLKLGTHVDGGKMYRVYWNQVAAAYSSLYFFSFLSLQFSNIKNFCCTFLRNCEAYKVETWYTRGQWVAVSCILHQAAASYLSLISSFFFLSNVQKLNIFVTLFSGTAGLESLNFVHLSTMDRCMVYTRIRLLQLICPFIYSFFFLSNYQTLTFFCHTFLKSCEA